jgi:hypothetical protein
MKKLCQDQGLISLKLKHLQYNVAQNVKIVHYKSGQSITSGVDFIRQFEDKWITGTLTKMPNVQLLCILEEKYHFTPDVFRNAIQFQ